ncbi:MAG: hypothetical protein ABFC81_01380 [Rectinema sp.]
MKSAWSDEYRIAVERVSKSFRRTRRLVVAVLALATALLAAVTIAGIAMRDLIPAYRMFVFAAPLFCAADWLMSFAFLRRLAASRDAALHDLDVAYRGDSTPKIAEKDGSDEV